MTSYQEMLDSYTQKRSFEEIVQNVVPDEAYNYVVDTILHDKKQNWSLDCFKPDGKSIQDVKIARMSAEKAKCDSAVKANGLLLEVLAENIRCARLHPTDKNYKKAKPIEISNWDKAYVQAEEDIMLDSKESCLLTDLIADREWNRYLELFSGGYLWLARNKFRYDNDMDFLKRAVTWACNYQKKSYIHMDGQTEPDRSSLGISLSAW
jgi:hypothetical protein